MDALHLSNHEGIARTRAKHGTAELYDSFASNRPWHTSARPSRAPNRCNRGSYARNTRCSYPLCIGCFTQTRCSSLIHGFGSKLASARIALSKSGRNYRNLIKKDTWKMCDVRNVKMWLCWKIRTRRRNSTFHFSNTTKRIFRWPMPDEQQRRTKISALRQTHIYNACARAADTPHTSSVLH